MLSRSLGFTCSLLLAVGCSKSEPTPDPCAACAAPNFCAAGECRAPGSPVLEGAVGTAAGQFGAEDREEAMPEAPMSLAISADGTHVAVLDQLNRRIQVYEQGELTDTIALDTETAEDVVLRVGGGYALVDRVADQLIVLDAKGKRTASTPLTGDGVSESGAVWNSYARADGVWIAAGKLFVRVLDESGKALSRRTIRTGVPSLDSEALYTVRSLADRSVEVVRRNARGVANYQQTQVVFDEPSEVLLQSELDAQGNLYLLTERTLGEDEQVVRHARVLDADLKVTREFELGEDKSARQSFKQFAVSESGVLVELGVTAEHVQVRRY